MLLPSWPGAAEGGGPSAPALSAIESKLSEVWQSQGCNSSPSAMQFPPDQSGASGNSPLLKLYPADIHAVALSHSAKDSGKEEEGNYCLQEDRSMQSMLIGHKG